MVIPKNIIDRAIKECKEDGFDPEYVCYDDLYEVSSGYPMYVNYLDDNWYSKFFKEYDRRI